jgi:hypothetical protein
MFKLFTKQFMGRRPALLSYIYFPDWLEASIVSGRMRSRRERACAARLAVPAGKKRRMSVSLPLTSYVHSASSTASVG